jgi:23S rRNA pseudouridine1911/1915/1917 synthase
MHVIYEDNHLLVVNKPPGLLVQGDQTGRDTLLGEARAWLKEKYAKPGQVFLGLVHRLDRMASGVVVLARTSKAAARLSEELRGHRPRKLYWALVAGEVPLSGRWSDRIERDAFNSRLVAAPAGKEARLSYRRLMYEREVSLVEIALETGRHHQIRVQFAERGFPILGDRRYGSQHFFADDAIALHAREMVIRHPTLREEMHFVAEPPAVWQNWVSRHVRA